MAPICNGWILFRLQRNIAAKLPAVTIDFIYDTSLISAGILVLALLLNS
jgi:hypothetical protein